jgi:hypothetical protein
MHVGIRPFVTISLKHEYMRLGESMNRGICNYHTCNYSRLHINVKFKAIFKINIIKFLIIHLIIDINENHHKKFG